MNKFEIVYNTVFTALVLTTVAAISAYAGEWERIPRSVFLWTTGMLVGRIIITLDNIYKQTRKDE